MNISISGIDAFRGLTSAYPAGEGPPAYGANQLARGYSCRLTMADFSPRTVTVSATAAGGVISSWLFVPGLTLWVPLAGAPLPETHASVSFDVGGPPRIVLEPVGQDVPQGDSAVLSAAATGSVPLAWKLGPCPPPAPSSRRASSIGTSPA